MAPLSELRRRFQHAPDCKFVTAEAYIKHLTGHQALVRSDEPSANLAGLLDRSTGTRFLVPVEELAKTRALTSTSTF